MLTEDKSFEDKIVFMIYDELTAEDDLPGLKDPLFVDALRVCITNKSASTSLLQRHLRVGYGRAAAMLDAMVREGFIGEMNGSMRARPVLISSVEELEQRINEGKRREQEEYEAFQNDFVRLLNSDEYKYVDQFTKKYGSNINPNELSKLRDLLKFKGFEFSFDRLTDVLSFTFNQQKRRAAKARVLNENANDVRDIIKIYLNFYRANDEEVLEVLKEIFEEKGLFNLVGNSREDLKKEVEKIEKEIELEIFEKRLLEEDAQSITLTDLDNISGYEFEDFLKNLFSKMGYQVEQTKLSGDQGADLVVVKFGEKTIIQAKRYGAKVGNYAVQEILAAMSLYRAQKGMVVTNNYFTPAAVELANANNIELIDRDALEKLINKHW